MDLPVEPQSILEIIKLSRMLGEFGQIKRTTKMPDGDYETDSHHSFSLALIAFDVANKYARELDTKKILLYSLVHDLPELVTGDVDTLNMTQEQLLAKAKNDKLALEQLEHRLEAYPQILEAVKAYETKLDDEALFVYWIDKMVTIPTHFYDQGANLRARGVLTQADIQTWYKRTIDKLKRHEGTPHPSAVKVLELAYQKMHDEILTTGALS